MLNTLIFAVGLLATVTTAAAQTTAFTYQGRLTDGGNPANGSFQMQFKLFAVSALRDADCNIAGVKYERLNILLISAVKEQQQQIEELRSKLQYMENRLRTRRVKSTPCSQVATVREYTDHLARKLFDDRRTKCHRL